MKLYAYATPDIAKHKDYLKIGETNGDVEKRVEQQGHEFNVEKKIVWRDVVLTERINIDKQIHRYLKEQGFQVQQFGTGQDTEWVECTVADVVKAFAVIKERLYQDEIKRQELGVKFYLEIRNWFYWTTQDHAKIDADYALRLVVRLMFCFFLREKNELVPSELLDPSVEKLLKSDEEYSYYNGILRNLFFHSINTPNGRKYEHEKLLGNHKKKIKDWFSSIPFLNSGLFDEHTNDEIPIGNDYFFSGKKERSLAELGETGDVYGIVTILSKYQYKLTLDDLLDQAEYGKTVDPELIGNVFESLLSCIDSGNKESRRKITGSYYTPREIVDYMVSEALDAYLENHDDLLRCKILDPACGSGAFPCGIMNEIMRRLDPHRTLPQSERYRKKLTIIQDVIYGVDVQPMAVQISQLRMFLSLIQEIVPTKRKEDHYGIKPLPNLETKFVCADTLIGWEKEKQEKLESPMIRETIRQLRETRSQHFTASSVQEKERLRWYDETLRKTLAMAMEDAGNFTHDTAGDRAEWNPYDTSSAASFFDPIWMFNVDSFDIVIGNPPYVESRSTNVSDELKTAYQKQVQFDFGELSRYITRGSDLLIYFFPRSITFLAEDGIGSLIVQNGWLNTDYGTKASQFLVKTLQHIKVIDSPFRHFNRKSANINTVITQFKKAAEVKQVSFDTMQKKEERIVTQKGKSFDLKDKMLSDMKWGMILATNNDLFSVLQKIIEHGKTVDQSFYTIGQGINVNKKTFIPTPEKQKFEQKTNMINAVFKEYQYTYTKFSYFLYHSFKPSPTDISILETINAEEFGNGSFTRKYPSIIMPRGIGELHYAGLLNSNALSNSFVDVYVDSQDEEKKLNVWLFCNSSLFFLYRELSGRKNLGGGLLKSEATDIKQFPLYFPVTNQETILAITTEMETPVPLPERLEMSVQKRIDDVVCSYFGMDTALRSKMITELLRLFRLRLEKAKT